MVKICENDYYSKFFSDEMSMADALKECRTNANIMVNSVNLSEMYSDMLVGRGIAILNKRSGLRLVNISFVIINKSSVYIRDVSTSDFTEKKFEDYISTAPKNGWHILKYIEGFWPTADVSVYVNGCCVYGDSYMNVCVSGVFKIHCPANMSSAAKVSIEYYTSKHGHPMSDLAETNDCGATYDIDMDELWGLVMADLNKKEVKE